MNNIASYAELKKSKGYEFLSKKPLDEDNIVLLGVGGSHAYGTNIEGSDLDIRGVATNSARAILTGQKFEQVVNEETDTVIYSLDKIISLLANCNPNTIEILGLRPEDYLYLSDIGWDLVENAEMFLSKKAVQSFAGYANSQLRRLDNKAVRLVDQVQQEQHILNSIMNATYTFPQKYFPLLESEDCINLYLDKAVNPEYETEIFMDVVLHHYPLRDYKSMWSEMHNICKDYAKIGKRNKHAIEHEKLGKHMMHLVRLYYMCFDILENGQIITYREKEHDELMAIRSGKYLDENQQPIPAFFEMIDELENKLNYWKEHTELPESPDYVRIYRFLEEANLSVVNHAQGWSY